MTKIDILALSKLSKLKRFLKKNDAELLVHFKRERWYVTLQERSERWVRTGSVDVDDKIVFGKNRDLLRAIDEAIRAWEAW